MKHNFGKIFCRVYPMIFRQMRRENLLMSSVDIFHGMSFAAVAILTQQLFDSITACVNGTGNGERAAAAAVVLILAQVISQILNGWVNFYSDVVREKGYGRVCAMMQKKIGRLRLIDFERNSFLTDLNMADEGAKEACAMVDRVNSIFTFYVPYFALMGIYLHRLDPILILALLLVFLPVLLGNWVKMRSGELLERQIAPARREAEAYERVLTGLDCYKETRTLGAAVYFLRLYREGVQRWNGDAWKRRKKEAFVHLGLNCFSFLAYGMILLLLAAGCVRGRISVGAFAAVFSSIDVMFLLMEEIFQDSLGSLSRDMGRISHFLNLMESPETEQEDMEINDGSIVLKNVSFRYPDAKQECLRQISLEIADKETVAVVGENGAGKTTLARIMLGLYQPDEGEVMVGGKAMDGCRNCFSSISAVFQQFNRYKLTLEENVCISDVRSTEAYERALHKVDAEWKTDGQAVLSRDFDGVDLSGGQWQTIAAARGIYRKSRILLLDEPTAAIDPLQEGRFYQIFQDMAKEKTCIIITHRLGLARIADRILVLKEGKIVENGSHAELLARKGEYSRMWEAQAGGYCS